MRSDSFLSRNPRAIIGIALTLLAFLGLGRSLWTPDEPREAEISREMYIHPTVVPMLDGEPFYEKPPLYYGLVAATFAVTGGPSVAGARAVSGLAGLLTLLALYHWAKRAAGKDVALIAVVLLATSSQFLYATHWVLLDPLLMLFTSLAWWAAWEAISGSAGARFVSLFYVAIALSLWTKGPIGELLIIAGLAVFFIVERERKPWRALHPVAGVLVILITMLSLAGAIFLDGGREALWNWGWVNQVQRFTNPGVLGHSKPFYFYLEAVPLIALPWLIPFVDLFREKFWSASSTTSGLRRFCATSFVGGVVLLSLSSSKRENYLLPLLAPFFVLLALAVEDRLRAVPNAVAATRWDRMAPWIQTTFLALLVLLPGAAAIGLERHGDWMAVMALVAGLLVAIRLLRLTAGSDLRRTMAWSGGAAMLAAAGALLVALPALAPRKDLDPFVRYVDTLLPADEPISALGADETLEGIVPFLTHRRVVELPAAPPVYAANPPKFLLVQGKAKGQGAQATFVPRDYKMVSETLVGDRRQLALYEHIPH